MLLEDHPMHTWRAAADLASPCF